MVVISPHLLKLLAIDVKSNKKAEVAVGVRRHLSIRRARFAENGKMRSVSRRQIAFMRLSEVSSGSTYLTHCKLFRKSRMALLCVMAVSLCQAHTRTASSKTFGMNCPSLLQYAVFSESEATSTLHALPPWNTIQGIPLRTLRQDLLHIASPVWD